MSKETEASSAAIWLYAFGYFAAYAPYAALTKALTSGMLGMEPRTGPEILPLSTAASLIGMIVFLSAKGWWRFATQRSLFGRSVPSPTQLTLISGLATAAVIGTTTLSYTIRGTSILVMMLFMRGGVLVLAPLVDLLSRRKVRWQAWAALGLSLIALIIGAGDGDTQVGGLGLFVIILYLASYFVRLRLMSTQAKSSDPDQGRRFFVEEQMVATPAIALFLGVAALIGGSEAFLQIGRGYHDVGGATNVALIIAIGVFSQFTGIFGALVLLDGRENSFCVPVNRASSVLAGLVGSTALWLLADAKQIPPRELFGALLLILAIVLLAVSPKARPASAPPAKA
ncbi:MAG: hypothetical protein IPM79_22860 [Polyangiaceae bacterium]|jgi:hypothetical protein|nr:hypothetical protein [Polyangiaceae bacterium]MBK8940377.1 hypothetical protein [Polyangiaceae bacterium]